MTTTSLPPNDSSPADPVCQTAEQWSARCRELERENDALRRDPAEASEIVDAFREDRVDAVVVGKGEEPEVRFLVEALRHDRPRLAWVLDTTGIGLWLDELPWGRLNRDHRTRELFFVPPGVEPTIELFWEHSLERQCAELKAALEDAGLI